MYYAYNHCKYIEDEKYFHFKGPCIRTGKNYIVKVPKIELEAYNKGELIQDALVSVNECDREFLISGISPEGWALIFK